MTCYFRHLSGVFERAGIEVTRKNRKELVGLIEGIIGEALPCGERQIKKRLAEN